MHDKIQAKYGADIADSVVARLRREAQKRKSDMGKEAVWANALATAQKDPSRFLDNADKAALHAKAQDARVATEAKTAKPYTGDVVSLTGLSLERAKVLLTLLPALDNRFRQSPWYVGKLEGGGLAYLSYDRGYDPKWKARPTVIRLIPVESEDRPKTWGEALKMFGLDPSRLQHVDYNLYNGRRFEGKSTRHQDIVHYDLRFFAGELKFLSDTYHGS